MGRVDSHALNKDSSRSHSLLTVYFDTEIIDDQDGHVLKKFGKLTFVDLAGRLECIYSLKHSFEIVNVSRIRNPQIMKKQVVSTKVCLRLEK